MAQLRVSPASHGAALHAPPSPIAMSVRLGSTTSVMTTPVRSVAPTLVKVRYQVMRSPSVTAVPEGGSALLTPLSTGTGTGFCAPFLSGELWTSLICNPPKPAAPNAARLTRNS